MSKTLKHEDGNLRTFVGRVAANVINVYSICSWVLGILGVLPIWSGQALPWLAAGAATFSLLPACYRAWFEVVEQLPPAAVLAVACQTSTVKAPIDNRVPQGNCRLDLHLEISNPTRQVVFLTSVETVSWNVPSTLFDGPIATKLHGQQAKGGFGELPLPIRFEPDDRRDDIALFVEMRPAQTDDTNFARSLMQQDADFSLPLRVNSENAARTEWTGEFEVPIPLEPYKTQVLRVWKANKHVDLIAAAGDLE